MKPLIEWRPIARELSRHIPFTAFGALTGIVFMVIVYAGGFLDDISPVSETVFYVLHPTHVFLSALVTTAIYRLHGGGKGRLWKAIIIGYSGAIVVATISDSIVPYLGETLAVLPGRELHIGFIDEPWITNPPAIAGIAVGYLIPRTRFPHAGHVLISTWASLFHIIMALGQTVSWLQGLAIFLFLFLAVWLPCCLSDIIYPMLFVREGKVEHHH